MTREFEKNSAILTSIKAYLFPTLVTILAMMIWRDVSELRSDVKALLSQSSIDKTKIENLERMLYGPSGPRKVTYVNPDMDKLYFKHEDIFDVKRYIPKIS